LPFAFPDSQHFRVRRHVGKLARSVSGRGYHLVLPDKHRADRNLAAHAGVLRLPQGKRHELFRLAHRLASPGTVC
jgi:hypothetical protein